MNRDYRDVIYTGHPPIRPFKVKIVNRDHPITKGVNDFIVTDEQHFVTYDKDPKFVLARSVNEDGLEYTDTTGRRGTRLNHGSGPHDQCSVESRVREDAEERREVAFARELIG